MSALMWLCANRIGKIAYRIGPAVSTTRTLSMLMRRQHISLTIMHIFTLNVFSVSTLGQQKTNHLYSWYCSRVHVPSYSLQFCWRWLVLLNSTTRFHNRGPCCTSLNSIRTRCFLSYFAGRKKDPNLQNDTRHLCDSNTRGETPMPNPIGTTES